jgi:4-amino-4-deoxy-L-arabinose transferase-like glycosyltransferase
MVRSTEARRRGPLIALQLALAAGVMAKGPIAVLLAGLPIAAVIILQHRWDLARTLSNWRSWLIFAALAVPWHAVVAILHDGFAWDYVVHQHFLRLIDQKLPRDSVPIPLTTFWAAFLGRTFPWTLFLPLALVFTWMRRHSQGWSSQLLLAWLTGTLLFFSLSSSRLEHYTLPAVPAVALLVAALFRNAAGPASKWTAPTRITLFIFGIGSLIGAVGAPALLRELDALRDLSGLGDIAGYYFAATAAGCAAAFVASRRLPFLPVPILAACLLLLTPLVVRSITIVARRHSSAPVAAELRRQADLSAAAVVFEAPIEYQHVAGLCFYLQRRIRLLRPEGFVPPAYLQPHVGELFINPGELQQMWRERPVFLVTNPLEPMPRTVELSLPTPLHHIADVANRSIYANRPPAETIGYGEMFD